jgi:hypothetical protein
MSKFKVGDRVRINDKFFGAAKTGATAVVEGFDDVWMCVKWVRDGMDGGQMDGHYYESEFELVSPSPIRTATRREIVPGTYGDWSIAVEDGELYIEFTGDEEKPDTAEQLREAANLFNQLAEVLEENAKAEAA